MRSEWKSCSRFSISATAARMHRNLSPETQSCDNSDGITDCFNGNLISKLWARSRAVLEIIAQMSLWCLKSNERPLVNPTRTCLPRANKHFLSLLDQSEAITETFWPIRDRVFVQKNFWHHRDLCQLSWQMSGWHDVIIMSWLCHCNDDNTDTKYLFPQPTWKLSNIGRTVGLVESEKEVPTKVLPFFARWLVFSEAWRWVILIKAETNDISVGAKRALHAGMATNHQNMPRKLIIGTQSAMLTSSFLKHQIAEKSTTRRSISGSVCIYYESS